MSLLLIAAALVLFVIVAFFPATRYGFISYDDPAYVTANSHVRMGLTPESVSWAFTTTEMGYWHPLAWLSHMLDVEIYGLRSGGHHLTSILLHTANTLLLFFLLHAATSSLWPSALVAAFFAVHPLRVESVVWVAERKDVLSTFFMLAALGTYGRYVRTGRSRTYLLSLLTYLLGLMAKPMLVTFGLLLFVTDFWPLARPLPSSVAGESSLYGKIRRYLLSSHFYEKIPFLLLAVFSSFTAILGQIRSHNIATLEGVSMSLRLKNALLSYVKYLGMNLWPKDLAFFYPLYNVPLWKALAAAFLLALLTLVALRLRRRHPYLAAGWLWYLLSLLPVIGIVQVGAQAVADRYTYIPSIGLFSGIAWGLRGAISRAGRSPRLPAAIALCFLFPLFLLTREQLTTWQDNETLFSHAVAVVDNNYLAMTNLGTEYLGQGRSDAAQALFETALEIAPEHFAAHYNLGLYLAGEGRLEEALSHMLKAVRLRPYSKRAIFLAGHLLGALGHEARALAAYEAATGFPRDSAQTRMLLAVGLLKYGDKTTAMKELRKVVKQLTAGLDNAEADRVEKQMIERVRQLEAQSNSWVRRDSP